MYHINKRKDKNLVIISINAVKLFWQNPVSIIFCNQVGGNVSKVRKRLTLVLLIFSKEPEENTAENLPQGNHLSEDISGGIQG